MDWTCFKKDIDELLNDFEKGGFMTLADMRGTWSAKKFSYIYEGRPKSKTAAFMQSLFAHCLETMVSDGTLSRRLGAVYCLYCLYETQPYRPSFKIYISLRELNKLKELVAQANESGISIFSALVQRMLDRNMFLYGFVDMVDCSPAQRMEKLTQLQSKRNKTASDMLLGSTNIAYYLDMNMGSELGLETLRKMSEEYKQAKKYALTESSKIIGTDDDNGSAAVEVTAPDVAERVAKEWDEHKEAFYRNTGVSYSKEICTADEFAEIEDMLQM